MCPSKPFPIKWLKVRTISISVKHNPVYDGPYFLLEIFSACISLSFLALIGMHVSPPKQAPAFHFLSADLISGTVLLLFCFYS